MIQNVKRKMWVNGRASVTIAAGSSSGSTSFWVEVQDDAADEPVEPFAISGSATGGVAVGEAVITIEDNDTAPTISIVDDVDEEGSSAEFAVNLCAASAKEVTVHYATRGGTAQSGTDFVATTGTLVIPSGKSDTTIAVATIDDDIDETAETFTVRFSGALNATLTDFEAVGTIEDNDSGPKVAIAPASVEEGDRAVFRETLSPASTFLVSVFYATVNGSAVAGADFTATSGTLRIPPGKTDTTIAVPTTEDNIFEAVEDFVIRRADPAECGAAR